MVTKESLEEISKLLDELNNHETDLSNRVEDIDLFTSLLNKVNTDTIKNISIGSNKKEIYSKEFKEKTVEELVKKYSKVQLNEIWNIFYNSKPLSKDTKIDIINKIKGYVHFENRNKKLLNS